MFVLYFTANSIQVGVFKNISGIVEALRSQQFVDKAVNYAIGRNPDLSGFPAERIRNLAVTGAFEISVFEALGLTNPLRVPKTEDEAKRIVAIWDLSAIGTFKKPFQDDRWKGTLWAARTDRTRLLYSETLIRNLVEIIRGSFYPRPLRKTPEQVREILDDINRFGPHLIYGSTLEQNDDLREAISETQIAVPQSKAYIIDDPEKPTGINTIDQMKSFKLPQGRTTREGDILAIVAHAPHMMRALHLANRHKPFPEGLIIQPHPLPSPRSAGTDYATQEISGLLYHALSTGDASEQIYPYQI